MSEPFLAEIRIFGFNFAPQGWAQCNGQLLPISQNTALFSLLGTMYGGDGKSTFALPDLRGAVPLAANDTLVPGSAGGEETVTLNSAQLPAHNHAVNCNSGAGNAYGPSGNMWAKDAAGTKEYAPGASANQMNAGAISPAGGGQPHNNIQPFAVVNYCIALVGIFPPRN